MPIKEYGSDFSNLVDDKYLGGNATWPLLNNKKVNFHFSGRSSVFHIVANGIKIHKWQKLLVPSYYCHEVTDFLNELPIKIEYYEITPFLELSLKIDINDDKSTTAIIIVDFFGFNKISTDAIKNAYLIEDITHSLNSFENNKADYVFASLRKSLPIPLGGFSYSKNNEFITPLNALNPKAIVFLNSRTKAMKLKSSYLANEFKDKDAFRLLYSETEVQFKEEFTNTEMPNLVYQQLERIDFDLINSSKKENLDRLKLKVKSNINFEVLSNDFHKEFAFTMFFFDANHRDIMRKHLIYNNIYPIILWPNQFTSDNISFQSQILFIHVDFRYTPEDMDIIAQVINKCDFNV